VRFHKEARIDELYAKSQPYFEAVIARYHEPVSRAVLEVNAYLRNPTSGYLGRRFQIYIDLLGAPNQVFSRSYADDYFVVVTPSPQPQVDYIRHAYLHYLLDPLSIRYGEEIRTKRSLEDFALGAPALEESFKNDFVLLTGECVIKAVEARLAPASARAAMIEQALREGFILTPFFAEQLILYEKQEAAMRYFYPEMIKAIDLKKETARLDKVEFLRERVVRRAKPAPAKSPEPLTGAAKTLAEAEEIYRARDLEKAREAFLQALRETDEKPLHAKAYYGLARIAALNKDPETAEKLFQRVLELQPDPQTKAWTLVYLGRLADAAGERGNAVESYRAALAVEGASEGAKEAARLGLKQSYARDK
jgi:tetratricopeptide (TPR) repeat protein